MRIEETNQILKDSKLRTKNGEAQTEWQSRIRRLASRLPGLMRDRRVQAGMAAAGAVAAMGVSAVVGRDRRRHWWQKL